MSQHTLRFRHGSGKVVWVEVDGMADILKVGRKGEVVLPRRARTALGVGEGDELLASFDEESIVLKRKARRFGEYLDSLSRWAQGRDRV